MRERITNKLYLNDDGTYQYDSDVDVKITPEDVLQFLQNYDECRVNYYLDSTIQTKCQIVGDIRSYLPDSKLEDIFVLNFVYDGERKLFQLGKVMDGGHFYYIHLGKPIVFSINKEDPSEIQELYDYLKETPLGSIEYLPEENLPTFAEEYMMYHFGFVPTTASSERKEEKNGWNNTRNKVN